MIASVLFIDQYVLPLITKHYKKIQIHLATSWAETWQMQFIVTKCSILQLSKRHHKSSCPYSMSGKLLKTIKQYYTIQEFKQTITQLSWNSQVDYVAICSIATRLIGFLQCNLCDYCSKELEELSYKQFVQPV